MPPLEVPRELYDQMLLLALCAARPLGFTLVFAAFTWAHATSGLLRMAIALPVALPVAAASWDRARETLDGLEISLAVAAGKETIIGIAVALLLSIPFHAMAIAGGVVDSYRGSSTPLPLPAGEITPFGQVFTVIALATFAVSGGFFIVFDVLYASYGIWPLEKAMPAPDKASLLILVESVLRLVGLGLLVAGPMLALLAAVDLVMAIAAKLGRHINVTFLAMGVKALVAVLVLPAYALVLVRVMEGETHRLVGAGALLRAFVP